MVLILLRQINLIKHCHWPFNHPRPSFIVMTIVSNIEIWVKNPSCTWCRYETVFSFVRVSIMLKELIVIIVYQEIPTQQNLWFVMNKTIYFILSSRCILCKYWWLVWYRKWVVYHRYCCLRIECPNPPISTRLGVSFIAIKTINHRVCLQRSHSYFKTKGWGQFNIQIRIQEVARIIMPYAICWPITNCHYFYWRYWTSFRALTNTSVVG